MLLCQPVQARSAGLPVLVLGQFKQSLVQVTPELLKNGSKHCTITCRLEEIYQLQNFSVSFVPTEMLLTVFKLYIVLTLHHRGTND